MSRLSTDVNASTGESSDEKRCRKLPCKFTVVSWSSGKIDSRDTNGAHCRGMAFTGVVHAGNPLIQKIRLRIIQGPRWQRWRLLGLYALEWWHQDSGFGSDGFQNVIESSIQRYCSILKEKMSPSVCSPGSSWTLPTCHSLNCEAEQSDGVSRFGPN